MKVLQIIFLNIYGEELKPCRNNNSDNNGSWDSQGYCSELDGGVFIKYVLMLMILLKIFLPILIKIIGLTKD